MKKNIRSWWRRHWQQILGDCDESEVVAVGKKRDALAVG